MTMTSENDIKANLTKLREMTGAGMVDCRNALVEAKGDLKAAETEYVPLNFKELKRTSSS